MTTPASAVRDRLAYALVVVILFPFALAQYFVDEQPGVVILAFWIAVAGGIALAWRWLA